VRWEESQANSLRDPIFKIARAKWIRGEALNSNSSPTKGDGEYKNDF
jgi:hypothetical protein